MKIIVTGHTGFVGRHLVGQLKEAGHLVIGLSRSTGSDLTNQNCFDGLDSFDILIHLAALSFVPLSFQQPQKFYYENFVSTLHCLEACRNSGAKMIFLSSYVYGQPQFLPITEGHPVHPTNPYMQSKLMGEELCQAYYRDFGVPVSIIRPFNIYGEGQGDNFLIPTILNQLPFGAIRLQDERPRRDFIHVLDLCEALINAIEYKEKFAVYNIGSGQTTSIGEVVEILVRNGFIKEDAVSFSHQQRAGEVLQTQADISKAIRELGWKPKRLFDEEILKLAQAKVPQKLCKHECNG